jgi:small subunit ribosomal protein S1
MELNIMTEEMGMEEFLSQSEDIRPGAVIDGTVVSRSGPFLLVDVGFKQEASLPIKEFISEIPSTGAKIPVMVVRVKGPEGRPLVSYKQARETKNWNTLYAKFESKEPISGKIVSRVKGGVKVDIGLDAFMPTSQIDLRTVYKPEEWMGKTVQVVILEMKKNNGSVLVSRKKFLEDERDAKRETTLQTLKVGQVVRGKVTGLAPFGAFVDIGGLEGLLHISDMTWIRVEHPQNLLKVGEEIEVKVTKFDPKTHKVSLSRKPLLPHPLDGMDKRYPIGSLVKGKVTALANFGAFVEIEPGVEGLIHISEMSWTDRIKNPKELLKVGQEVETKLIGFDREKEKISLSVKRMGDNPWETAAKLYPKGTQVEGEIINVVPFGVFVRIPIGIEGLLKVQDVSWTEKSVDLHAKYKVGDKINAVVTEINPKAEKLALGIKQMSSDPLNDLSIGKVVKAKIQKITDFGIFVKTELGLDALIRKNEIHDNRRKRSDQDVDLVEHRETPYQVGETISASVTKVSRKDRKIELSIRRYERAQEKELLRKYSGQQGNPTLGEATGWTSQDE